MITIMSLKLNPPLLIVPERPKIVGSEIARRVQQKYMFEHTEMNRLCEKLDGYIRMP